MRCTDVPLRQSKGAKDVGRTIGSTLPPHGVPISCQAPMCTIVFVPCCHLSLLVSLVNLHGCCKMIAPATAAWMLQGIPRVPCARNQNCIGLEKHPHLFPPLSLPLPPFPPPTLPPPTSLLFCLPPLLPPHVRIRLGAWGILTT